MEQEFKESNKTKINANISSSWSALLVCLILFWVQSDFIFGPSHAFKVRSFLFLFSGHNLRCYTYQSCKIS